MKKSSSSILVHPGSSSSGLLMAGGSSSSVSSSNFEGLAEIKSEVNSVLSTSDLQLASTSAVVGNHFKIETLMVEQPALGALDGDDRNGGHWKCHECLIVFTSAQDLHRHQEEFKLAKFKCHRCHVIYNDRKSLLAHQLFHFKSVSFHENTVDKYSQKIRKRFCFYPNCAKKISLKDMDNHLNQDHKIKKVEEKWKTLSKIKKDPLKKD